MIRNIAGAVSGGGFITRCNKPAFLLCCRFVYIFINCSHQSAAQPRSEGCCLCYHVLFTAFMVR